MKTDSLCCVGIDQLVVNFGVEIQRQIPANFGPKKKVVVLAGPTCSGKSRLAIQLAEAVGGEVISADSIQVYRGMDIGTAKLSCSERQLVPHHLIDIRDIQEGFNVVDFYYEARNMCQKILNAGKIPIFAGGSGFYLHALLYGPPSGPPSVPELRQSLEEEIEQRGADVLYERLLELDPHYAKTITRNDKQKIVRAIEIMTLTNRKVSEHSWKGRRKPQQYDFRCWFIHLPKEQLYKRIEERCDQMLKSGFLDEVKKLDSLGLRSNHSAAQAIGYRQALDFLLTPQTAEDYEAFVTAFKQATRHYAKRQFTWFKKEPLFQWLDLQHYPSEAVVDILKRDLDSK